LRLRGLGAGAAEPSSLDYPRWVFGQVFQEEGIHRALESDVQVRDVAFRKGDDIHAGEGQTLEETRGVLLVATEAVERFGENDVELMAQGVAHQRLESPAQ
jgi:hypothetical protein